MGNAGDLQRFVRPRAESRVQIALRPYSSARDTILLQT